MSHTNSASESSSPSLPKRGRLSDISCQLTCGVCQGYLIDATTIIECLHSFCRSCIVKHLESEKSCPKCALQLHKTKPFMNIRDDKALQEIVYKLVPDVFKNEMKRRREFYAKHPEANNGTSNPTAEDRGESFDRMFYKPQDKISLSLEYGYGDNQVSELKNQQQLLKSDATNGDNHISGDKTASSTSPNHDVNRRYLLCPAGLSVLHLKKFIVNKYGLSSTYKVDIMYFVDELSDDYTLMDIAYEYQWRRSAPMRLFYRINERPLKRWKASHLSVRQSSTSEAKTGSGNGNGNNSNISSGNNTNNSASNTTITPHQSNNDTRNLSDSKLAHTVGTHLNSKIITSESKGKSRKKKKRTHSISMTLEKKTCNEIETPKLTESKSEKSNLNTRTSCISSSSESSSSAASTSTTPTTTTIASNQQKPTTVSAILTEEPARKLRKIVSAVAKPITTNQVKATSSNSGVSSLRQCRISNDKNKSVYISARETSQKHYYIGSGGLSKQTTTVSTSQSKPTVEKDKTASKVTLCASISSSSSSSPTPNSKSMYTSITTPSSSSVAAYITESSLSKSSSPSSNVKSIDSTNCNSKSTPTTTSVSAISFPTCAASVVSSQSSCNINKKGNNSKSFDVRTLIGTESPPHSTHHAIVNTSSETTNCGIISASSSIKDTLKWKTNENCTSSGGIKSGNAFACTSSSPTCSTSSTNSKASCIVTSKGITIVRDVNRNSVSSASMGLSMPPTGSQTLTGLNNSHKKLSPSFSYAIASPSSQHSPFTATRMVIPSPDSLIKKNPSHAPLSLKISKSGALVKQQHKVQQQAQARSQTGVHSHCDKPAIKYDSDNNEWEKRNCKNKSKRITDNAMLYSSKVIDKSSSAATAMNKLLASSPTTLITPDSSQRNNTIKHLQSLSPTRVHIKLPLPQSTTLAQQQVKQTGLNAKHLTGIPASSSLTQIHVSAPTANKPYKQQQLVGKFEESKSIIPEEKSAKQQAVRSVQIAQNQQQQQESMKRTSNIDANKNKSNSSCIHSSFTQQTPMQMVKVSTSQSTSLSLTEKQKDVNSCAHSTSSGNTISNASSFAPSFAQSGSISRAFTHASQSGSSKSTLNSSSGGSKTMQSKGASINEIVDKIASAKIGANVCANVTSTTSNSHLDAIIMASKKTMSTTLVPSKSCSEPLLPISPPKTLSELHDDKVSTTTNDSETASQAVQPKSNNFNIQETNAKTSASNVTKSVSEILERSNVSASLKPESTGNLVIRISTKTASLVDAKPSPFTSDKSPKEKSTTSIFEIKQTENSNHQSGDDSKVVDVKCSENNHINCDTKSDDQAKDESESVVPYPYNSEEEIEDDDDDDDDYDDDNSLGGRKLVVVVPNEDACELSDVSAMSSGSKVSCVHDDMDVDVDSGRGSDIARSSCDDMDIGSPQSMTIHSLKSPQHLTLLVTTSPSHVSSSSYCTKSSNSKYGSNISPTIHSPPCTPTCSPNSGIDCDMSSSDSVKPSTTSTPGKSSSNTPLDLSTHKKEGNNCAAVAAPLITHKQLTQPAQTHSSSQSASISPSSQRVIYDIPPTSKPKQCINPAIRSPQQSIFPSSSGQHNGKNNDKSHSFASLKLNLTPTASRNHHVTSLETSSMPHSKQLTTSTDQQQKSSNSSRILSPTSSPSPSSRNHSNSSNTNQSNQQSNLVQKTYSVVTPDPNRIGKMVIRNIGSPPMANHKQHK